MIQLVLFRGVMMRYPDEGTFRVEMALTHKPAAGSRRAIGRAVRQIGGCLRVKFDARTLTIEYAREDKVAVLRRIKEILKQYAPECLEGS